MTDTYPLARRSELAVCCVPASCEGNMGVRPAVKCWGA